MTDLVTTLPQVRAGTIKAYAVAGNARLAQMPEIPTAAEAGVSGLAVSFWHGLWAPRGTPKEIVTKLNGAVIDALSNADVRLRLADLGQSLFARDQQTPEALAAHLRPRLTGGGPSSGRQVSRQNERTSRSTTSDARQRRGHVA